MSAVILSVSAARPLFAQEAGGEFNPFGSLDDEPAVVSGGGGVTVGGELSAGITGYLKDIADDAGGVRAGDIVDSSLTFSAGGDSAEAFVSLQLNPVLDGKTPPVILDEAYLSVFFGALTVDAGLRKLTWGKADSEGPLDVINPVDYANLSELKAGDPLKIARPLVHAAFRFGDYSKVEAVFVPWFKGHFFAEEGRWEPDQMKALKQMLAPFGITPISSDTTTLSYFQTGARFSTTVLHSDIGVQYYAGFLPRPAYSVKTATPIPVSVVLGYNRYHQIGLDYAVEAAGFNIRAEAAVNITGDLSGDDPSVYNPHLLWSLGLDRKLPAEINLNLQCNEKIRLLDVGENPFDIEEDAPLTSTRVTAELSRAFSRDTVRLSAAAIWGIEDKDALLLPSVTFVRGNAELELSAGFFVGDRDGELGQYRDNNFVRAGITYRF
ncbi:MAG: hypothetical protein LBG27_11455 [Spirochaetaceae bacterium]|nr:hypothetical protein [Spirochaetaceae bacterium]